MKTLENGIEIYSINASTAGYGHKKITVELRFENNYKTFAATTDCMPMLDEANDLEGDDRDNALYNLIDYKIKDSVNEWLNDLELNS